MNHFARINFLFAAVFAASFAVAAQQIATAWTPEMQLKVKVIGAPRVSPDGKMVVYTTVSEMMTPERSEVVRQIFMTSADGSQNRQITFGDKSSTNPKWSPDGSQIAFTSNRKDNKNNLYLLRIIGGEAEPITDLKSSIADFDWSPDGRSIAYLMTDHKSETEEQNDKSRNDFRFVDENVKQTRLYVVSLQKDQNGKREPRKLTAENYNVTNFDWSPDAARIVFSFTKTTSANDWTTSDIALIEIATGKTSILAATQAAETAPVFAPDGKSVAHNVRLRAPNRRHAARSVRRQNH